MQFPNHVRERLLFLYNLALWLAFIFAQVNSLLARHDEKFLTNLQHYKAFAQQQVFIRTPSNYLMNLRIECCGVSTSHSKRKKMKNKMKHALQWLHFH